MLQNPYNKKHSRPKPAQDDDADSSPFEILIDSLSVMLEKDQTEYSCQDYLEANYGSCNRGTKLIAPEDRSKIVDWCYEIVDRCRFKRETVAIVMNMVDRFAAIISTSPDSVFLQGHQKYQLLAVTALYIAIKIHEQAAFSLQDFAAMSRGIYSAEDIEMMEGKNLHGLEWRLSAPTSLQIGYHIIECMELRLVQQDTRASLVPQGRRITVKRSTWDFLRDELAYQTEIAVREYSFVTERSSTVAVAALLFATDQVNASYEYEVLMKGLVSILEEMDFEPVNVLLKAKVRLSALIDNEEDENEDDGFVMNASHNDVTGWPADQDAGNDFSRNDETRRASTREGTMTSQVGRQEDSFLQSVISAPSCPPVLVGEGDDDDDSIATVYGHRCL